MKTNIPLIIGVTGHRDLVDEKKLKEVVMATLKEYQNAYPSTQIIVLSALAEGADMLVAEVARELGLRLDVVLPYDEKLYLGSFKEAAAKKRFLDLKEYATFVKTLPCDKEKEGSKTCYKNLGKYIVDNSNILLALWDGVMLEKEGGTSDVVNYARECFEEKHFEQFGGRALVVVNTPRVSNPEISGEPYAVYVEYPGLMNEEEKFTQVWQKIDAINSRMQLQQESKDEEDLLERFRAFFSRRARKAQRSYKLVMIAILVLSFISVFSMESMHVLRNDSYMWGYGSALLLAFGVYYYFIKRKDLKDRFIHHRGIAEALRVQRAWWYGGIEESVASNYLSGFAAHPKYTWIRVILRNINYLAKAEPREVDLDFVKREWIDDQFDYMKDAISQREKKLQRYEKIEKFLYKAGLVVLVVLFVWFMLEQFHIVKHGALPFSWHYLVLVSSALLAAAAFIGEQFLKIEAYEEEIQNFKIMKQLYEWAQTKISDAKTTSQKTKTIIKDLGTKALEENSKWVVVHDSRDIEPGLE